jgi:muramidase (phage lysozyme)
VSQVVKDAGKTFERASSTKAATEARRADLKDLGDELARLMRDVAVQELGRASQPYVVFSFGGQMNDYNEHTLDLPPADAVRNMMTSAAVAHDKVMKQHSLDTDQGAAEGKAMLVSLGKALGVIPND